MVDLESKSYSLQASPPEHGGRDSVGPFVSNPRISISQDQLEALPPQVQKIFHDLIEKNNELEKENNRLAKDNTRLKRLSVIDDLTQVPNLRALKEKASEYIGEMRRYLND